MTIPREFCGYWDKHPRMTYWLERFIWNRHHELGVSAAGRIREYKFRTHVKEVWY